MLKFQDCKEIIAAQIKRGLDKKKLANNTYLRKIDESCYAVTLHKTDVVYVTSRAGETVYRLNTSGYRTVTTKDRINNLSPASIHQRRGVWYLSQPSGEDVVFFDGIEVDSTGRVLNTDSAPADIVEKSKKLDRMICDYILGFAEDALRNGLGRPSAGDCLLCSLHAQTTNLPATDDYQHVYSHLEEKYYTRSFLLYCMKVHGYVNPSFNWALLESECEKGIDTGIRRELRYGLSKMKDQMMQFVQLEKELVAS